LKHRVLYLGSGEGFESTQDTLSDIADVVHVDSNPSIVGAELKLAAALLDASMKVRISNEMVASASSLQIISCATTGSDHIERDVLEVRKIPVRTLKEDPEFLVNLTPAAELSWALLMACARNMAGALKHVLDGQWQRELFPGVMLNGRRLGLIGCGRIGGWMSRYAQAFGMDVIGYDPHMTSFPSTIRKASIDEVLATSDFISIHVHLTPATEKMLDRGCFEKMKQGAIFINTSRGGLVDEHAMLDALNSGRLAAAGVDVLNGEPDIGNHPLLAYARSNDNLLITPHCGGFSPDAVRKVCGLAAQKIRHHLLKFETCHRSRNSLRKLLVMVFRCFSGYLAAVPPSLC
jgi:phosphoglycerate dehydrogenase-like enzyme